MRASLRSSTPREVGYSTGSHCGVIVGSTTPSTVAICQIRQPHSAGRAYFDRKVAEGKTKREALRSLKRHVSNALFRQLLIDSEGVREDTKERLFAGGRLCILKAGSLAKSLPNHPKPTHLSRLVAGRFVAPERPCNWGLDSKRIRTGVGGP